MRIVCHSIRLLRCHWSSSLKKPHDVPAACLSYLSSSLARSFSQPSLILFSRQPYSTEKPKIALESMYPTGKSVPLYLQRLADGKRQNKVDQETVLSNPIFKDIVQDLVRQLENSSRNLNYDLLDLCLIYRSLLELGLPPNHEVHGLLERLIMGSLETANFEHLQVLLGVHHLSIQTRHGIDLVKEITLLSEQMISRLPLTQLCFLLKPHQYPLPSFILEKIESAALSLISQVTDHQMYVDVYLRYIFSFAKSGRRPLSLLHILNQAIGKCDLTNYPEPLHLINVVAALNKLNYLDLGLLAKMEATLVNNDYLKLVKMSALSTLLISAGKMNWRCELIMEQIAQFIMHDTLPLRQQELVAFVTTASKLNFNPNYLSQIISEKILPEVKQASIPDALIWLDFVWSLVILDQASASHIESIFNKSFISQLKESSNPEAHFSRWKFMNIATYARLKGIQFDESSDLSQFKSPVRNIESTNQGNFAADILTSFVVRQKDAVIGFESPIGCLIDAEFIVNKDLKVLPISEYGNHVTPLKELPPGFKRINLIGFGFKDLIINDSSLIGPRQFIINALKQLETNVIIIKSNELNQQMKPVERVKLLKSKISEFFS